MVAALFADLFILRPTAMWLLTAADRIKRLRRPVSDTPT
jgi:hypothetical protein